MPAEIAELKDDCIESFEQFGKCLNSGNYEDTAVGAKIAGLLGLNASASEHEQLNLKEHVDYTRGVLNDTCSIAGESIAAVSSFLEEKVQKTVEVSQVQFIDKTIDVPVVRQRRVPTIQPVQKTVEKPQVQFPDRVADVPVVSRRQVPGPLIQEEIVEVIRIADSEDLPLNIPGETLLKNKSHVTKYLEMLAEIAEQKDDYKMFHEKFVKCMKLENVELLRFNTFKPGYEQFSFEEHVDHMMEGQNNISYITDENICHVLSVVVPGKFPQEGS